MASIVVTDDGPGVEPEDVDAMLRPVGRLDEARSTSGLGLGLAIVNGIARLHSGVLELEHLAPGLLVSIGLPILVAAKEA